MKMSPWRSQGVLQAGVAVIKRDAPVQSLIDVDFRSGKREALSLLGDLKTLTFPLHDVVVADHALVDEAADAIQVFGRGAPCGLLFSRAAGEAAVVVGKKAAQDSIGGVQIASLSQAELAGKTILEHAPEAFDAALGLRTAGGDEGQAEGGEHGAAAFQPVVGRAVELYQFAFTSGSQATLAMSGSASFSGRPQTGLAQKTAEGLAAEGKALDLAKFFAKVVIIEAG